jgi:hypothetical protein
LHTKARARQYKRGMAGVRRDGGDALRPIANKGRR